MKSVFIGSIPNAEKEDILLTKQLIKSTENSNDLIKLENKFKEKFGFNNVFFLNTGRSSLYAILKVIDIKKNDEVITQSFSCMAASQPIIWCGAKPVYADIQEDDFNIDIEDIKRKITHSTRAVIIQHTFGIPIDLRREIDKINKERDLNKKIFLIEDCAHSLGAKINDKYVGHQGDFSFFSFSQDKVVSSIQGGAVVVNNEKYIEAFKKYYNKLETIPNKNLLYLLKYQLYWNYIKNTYFFPNPNLKFTLGRALVLILRKLGHIKQQVDINNPYEREVFRLSSKQAQLLNLQIDKIEKLNSHRQKIANIYNKELLEKFKFEREGIYLRYPVLISNTEEIHKILSKEKIIIGNWYNHPIYPNGVNLEIFGYKNDCPIAEEKCKYIINLPTNIEVDLKTAEYIAKAINKYGVSI